MGLSQSECGTVTVRVWDCCSLSVGLLQSECGTVAVCVWNCYSLSVGLLQSECGTVTVCVLWDCYSLHLVLYSACILQAFDWSTTEQGNTNMPMHNHE